jgi:hypothetical protein
MNIKSNFQTNTISRCDLVHPNLYCIVCIKEKTKQKKILIRIVLFLLNDPNLC